LTFSYSIGGEHATCINGNGSNPGIKDILVVAKNIGLKERKAKIKAKIIADDIKNIIDEFGILKYTDG